MSNTSCNNFVEMYLLPADV